MITKKLTDLCNELCALLGHKSWTKVGRRCTGKWAGTTDYSLQWEDGTTFFVTNGMTYFEKTVKETVDMLKRTRTKEHQKAIMDVLREYEKDDAILSKENGMKSYKVLGLIEVTGDSSGLIWWGLRLDIGGKVVDFRETGLSCDIMAGADKLRETKEREKGRDVWVAGGVKNPDYIIHGVAHQSDGGCYKPCVEYGEKITYYPFDNPLSMAEQLRAALQRQLKA